MPDQDRSSESATGALRSRHLMPLGNSMNTGHITHARSKLYRFGGLEPTELIGSKVSNPLLWKRGTGVRLG